MKVENALRVVSNGDGAEVIFTVLQMEGTTDEAFAADANHVLKDLKFLKDLLER